MRRDVDITKKVLELADLAIKECESLVKIWRKKNDWVYHCTRFIGYTSILVRRSTDCPPCTDTTRTN